MTNLILVYQPTKMAMSDYETIARGIAAKDVGVETFIVDTKQLDWDEADEVARTPTMTMSPLPIKKFKAPRGPVFQGYEFPKGEQYQMMRDIGVSVPDWVEISPDTKLDPQQWGPYVVVKPALGRKGAEIRIKRTERVKHTPPESFSEDHPGSKAPMLAQKFVYTGRWPVNYRVVTLFGKTIMAWRCEVDHGFTPLDERFGFGKGGVTIVSNKKSSRYTLTDEPDVLALAEHAHAAFPGQPLLGSDIVRDIETGELFVLEASPRGDTWYMSSDTGYEIQDTNGLNFTEQFGALDLAIDILAEKTLEAAR